MLKRHPNILPLVGATLASEHPCLYLELPEKMELLQNYLEYNIDLDTKINIIEGIAKALQYLHINILGKPIIYHNFVTRDSVMVPFSLFTSFRPLLIIFQAGSHPRGSECEIIQFLIRSGRSSEHEEIQRRIPGTFLLIFFLPAVHLTKGECRGMGTDVSLCQAIPGTRSA